MGDERPPRSVRFQSTLTPVRVPALDEPLLARDAVQLGTAPVRPVHGIGVIGVAPRLGRRFVLSRRRRGSGQECRSDETSQDRQGPKEQIRLHRRCSLRWKSWRDSATKACGPSDCREWAELGRGIRREIAGDTIQSMFESPSAFCTDCMADAKDSQCREHRQGIGDEPAIPKRTDEQPPKARFMHFSLNRVFSAFRIKRPISVPR